MSVLLGADPELFAFKDGKPVSVHNLLTGDKRNPQPVDEGAVQVDGTAAEFNILPTDSEEVFVNRIIKVRKNIESIIQSVDKNVVLRSVPAVHFDKEYWDSIPTANKELGCDPDYNAYTGLENQIVPEEKRMGFETMRTGSGHIHIGWRNPKEPFQDDIDRLNHFVDCRVITMLLDHVILPFEKFWDGDKDRRKLYGKPGAFRPKPYGCEYRVLSNAWVDQPDVAGLLFRVITDLVNQVKNKNFTIRQMEDGSISLENSESITGRFHFNRYIGSYDTYAMSNNSPIWKMRDFFKGKKPLV